MHIRVVHSEIVLHSIEFNFFFDAGCSTMGFLRMLLAVFCFAGAIGSLAALLLPPSQHSSEDGISVTPLRALDAQEPVDGQTVQAVVWSIRNRSSDSVKIESVLTDCGCTVVKKMEKELKGGSTGEIITERKTSLEEAATKNYGIHVQYTYAGQPLRQVSCVMSPDEYTEIKRGGP